MTDPSGVAIVPLPVPGDPLLQGLELFGQWVIVDAATGLAFTSGLHIVVQDA